MRSKLFLVLAAVAALLFGITPAATADTDTRITLRPGDGFTDSGNNGWCSFAAFGRDNAGRLVALSAGHCWASWANNLYLEGNTAYGVIGHQTNVYKPGEYKPYWPGGPAFGRRGTLDYLVVTLDETKVKVSNSFVNPDNGQTVQVNGIDAPPTGTGNYGVHFMAGHTSGVDASYLGLKTDQWWVQSYVTAGEGDSGGALVVGTKLAGILVGGVPDAPPVISTNIESVIADINAQGSYGAGFTLYNTP
jgi:hypothetical protein